MWEGVHLRAARCVPSMAARTAALERATFTPGTRTGSTKRSRDRGHVSDTVTNSDDAS
jgi:hypothetical protein